MTLTMKSILLGAGIVGLDTSAFLESPAVIHVVHLGSSPLCRAPFPLIQVITAIPESSLPATPRRLDILHLSVAR